MMKYQNQQNLCYRFCNKVIVLSALYFLTACATPGNLIKENKITSGMNKSEVDSVIIFKSFWNQIFIPESYREYFPKERKEILSGTERHVYYIFKNVDTKVKCGWLMCEYGNGIFDKAFFNYKDAVKDIVKDEKIAAKKKPKKTMTIIEDNKETEVPEDDEMMKKLTKLMEDYKKGKISKEEFASKKTEILR